MLADGAVLQSGCASLPADTRAPSTQGRVMKDKTCSLTCAIVQVELSLARFERFLLPYSKATDSDYLTTDGLHRGQIVTLNREEGAPQNQPLSNSIN